MINNDKKLFEELNTKLKESNLNITVICVGGYVLNRYGIRATQDIDSFYNTNHTIDSIIREIGDKYNINKEDENWLNNSVMNMNRKPPESICETIYEFSNLKVMTPPLDYICCMKLYSAREQDIKDVAEIIKKQKIENPEAIEKNLIKYGFGDTDESLILEAFGDAYGMNWLEKYYIENEEMIIKKSEIGLSGYEKSLKNK